jgi:hypothetical protein
LTTGDLLERLHGEGIELSLSPREGYVIARPEWVLTEEIEGAIVDHNAAYRDPGAGSGPLVGLPV